jgi:hypothetical protein
MKPKNKFQKQVFALSQKLPRISKAQKEWAIQNCIRHIGLRTVKGVITCLDCGHRWQGNGVLADTILDMECPHCCAKLDVIHTRKRVFRQSEYFCTVTTKGGFQVLRFFFLQYHAKAGEKAQFSISEVVQRWIAPNGKYETIAKTKPLSYYEDTWSFSSRLEIRPEREHHHINPTGIYPRQQFLDELKRSGYTGETYRINPFTLFHTLLLDSRAETLLKAGQANVLKYFAGKNFDKISDYWTSLKICIRNGYQISDVSIWRDYIDLLRFFGKDLHNAHYVCPADLTAEHDRYVKMKRVWQERERKKEKEKKALEDEAAFRELKSRFFGIAFTDGIIQIRVLESVKEVMQEGDILHHCVFANEYHLKADSLILSACVNGQRMETVEFSLSQMKVVQSRGIRNNNTEYHDQIINLVNKNKQAIRKRIAA